MADLVISFLSGVPASIKEQFDNDTIFVGAPVGQAPVGHYPGGRAGYRMWLNEFGPVDGNIIRSIYTKSGGRGSIGRVCVMGFSNGCIGVDETLKFRDAPKIDVVIACDGIHGGFAGPGKMSPLQYINYLNHAVHVGVHDPADETSPMMFVTHSSIDPVSYPSTTATAQLIYEFSNDKIKGLLPPDQIGRPNCLDPGCYPEQFLEFNLLKQPWTKTTYRRTVSPRKEYTYVDFIDGMYSFRAFNNVLFMGWGERGDDGRIHTRDPSGNVDHVFQAQGVLPTLIRGAVVERWNAGCGATAGYPSGTAFSFAGPLDPPAGDEVLSCLKHGKTYEYSDEEKQDYFPDLTSQVPAPDTGIGPAPAGQDPGKLPGSTPTEPNEPREPGEPNEPGEEPLPAEEPPSTVEKILWTGVAFGAAWYLTRKIL